MPLDSKIRERLFPRECCEEGPVSIQSRQPPQVHLVGAGGAGMTALAEVLLDFGWKLTGSDLQSAQESTSQPFPSQNGEERQKLGTSPRSTTRDRLFRIHQGHDSANVPCMADLLIFSPAIGPDNPERAAAQKLNIPEVSYVEFLGELLHGRTGVCIAGTHGKTTTSAMTASILREGGVASSTVIGGEVIQYERSGWAAPQSNSSGQLDQLFVVEACEYRRHFLQFHPRIAAILNIEADHFDCFRSLDESLAAFATFASQMQPGGTLIVRADCPLIVDLSDICPASVETLIPIHQSSSTGRNTAAQADWAISSLREETHQTVFDIVRRGREFGTVKLSLPGLHNVENALAAVALAHAAGVPGNVSCAAMNRFLGVRRRFEEIGTWNGVTLVDDYAHHPSAIRATLAAARKRYPGRRLIVAFQPHQVSRTQNLMIEFSRSFSQADHVFLVPVFAARENTEAAESTLLELADRINQAGCSVKVLASLDQLQATLEDSAQPGDVWLSLGAGNINRIPHEFARTLQRNYAG